MTKLYNKKTEKEKRRFLRKNSAYTEKLIWMYIRKKQILGQRFLRQFSIDKYVVDFYCPVLRLIIEIDGDSHFEDEEAILYDKAREEYLKGLGLKIIRFRNKEGNNNIYEVINKIKEEIIKILKVEEPPRTPPF